MSIDFHQTSDFSVCKKFDCIKRRNYKSGNYCHKLYILNKFQHLCTAFDGWNKTHNMVHFILFLSAEFRELCRGLILPALWRWGRAMHPLLQREPFSAPSYKAVCKSGSSIYLQSNRILNHLRGHPASHGKTSFFRSRYGRGEYRIRNLFSEALSADHFLHNLSHLWVSGQSHQADFPFLSEILQWCQLRQG